MAVMKLKSQQSKSVRRDDDEKRRRDRLKWVARALLPPKGGDPRLQRA
jgi:hypothetical protein